MIGQGPPIAVEAEGQSEIAEEHGGVDNVAAWQNSAMLHAPIVLDIVVVVGGVIERLICHR